MEKVRVKRLSGGDAVVYVQWSGLGMIGLPTIKRGDGENAKAKLQSMWKDGLDDDTFLSAESAINEAVAHTDY